MAIIIQPEIRRTSELPFHSDDAPGKRFVFVEKSLFFKSELYVIGRRVENVPQNQIDYIQDHRHNCNSFYLFIGDDNDLTGIEAEVNIEDKRFIIQSPSTVLIPAYSLHNYKLTKGCGWFFNIILCGDYNKSLALEHDVDLPLSSSNVDKLCKKSERNLKKAGNLERPLISPVDEITNPSRWIFVDPTMFKNAGIYLAVHQIFSNKPFQYKMKSHHHKTDEVYIVLRKDIYELEIYIIADNSRTKVKSPLAIYHPQHSNHKYEYISGEGLILIILKENIPGEGYKFTFK